jgi:hypothetical protein
VHLPSKFAKTANMNKTNFHLEQIQYRYKKRRFDGKATAQKSEKNIFYKCLLEFHFASIFGLEGSVLSK